MLAVWRVVCAGLPRERKWLRRLDSFNGGRFAELARAAKPRLGEFNAQDKNKRTWLGQNC